MPAGRPRNTDIPDATKHAVILKVIDDNGFNNNSRSIIMYILAVSLNYGNIATHRSLQIPHPTVLYHCQQVEDKRDSPAYDTMINKLEKHFEMLGL